MAGEFSRVGNGRALARALALLGSSEADQIGTINATVAAGTTGVVSLTTTALSKAIPNGCVIVCVSTTGTNVEAYTVGAAAAAAATAITVTSQTANKARAVGDPIYILQFSAYLALTTTAPTDNALGTEYAATGYARQAVAWTAPTAADPPVTQNTALITFGPFTAGTGSTIGYVELMDSLSGGTNLNMYAWWTLTTAKTPAVNDSATIAAGALTMSCL